MILLPAAAIETAAEEGDFLVVVVFVAAIQWRVGKTTAGMTNRALNTNWPSSGIAVSARRRPARTRTPRQTRTLSIFSPLFPVHPLSLLKSTKRSSLSLQRGSLRPALYTPFPSDNSYCGRRSAAAHSSIHTKTIVNDYRLRRPTTIAIDSEFVRVPAIVLCGVRIRTHKATTAVRAARGGIACTRSVPTAARTTPRSIVTPLNRRSRAPCLTRAAREKNDGQAREGLFSK